MEPDRSARDAMGETITLFFCGDVMTGRGVDQILPAPCSPELHEAFVRDARDYVALAERRNGPIPRPVGFDYIWGAALDELYRFSPHIRLINLETSITGDGEPWPGKGIHYRMHPANARCLLAARISVCALANNHVLDWGHNGLRETCRVLDDLGIARAGAGEDAGAASAPAILEAVAGNRLLIWSIGLADSGIPPDWEAREDEPGVWLMPDTPTRGTGSLAHRIRAEKRPGDRVVISVHWGSNWGHGVAPRHRALGRYLVDAGADLVHGHSSHHPRGMELYRGRPILYGCGDFINDYEGIGGHEQYRPELALAYFCRFGAAAGAPLEFWMTPLRIERLSLQRATEEEACWLRDTLNRHVPADTPAIRLDREGRLRWF